MRKTMTLAAASLLLVGLAGCANSPVPLSENFQLTKQQKVRSAGHWNIISQDVVKKTLAGIEKFGPLSETKIYVAQSPEATPFDRAFSDFLVTELVDAGAKVVSSQEPGALRLSYKAQVVRHNSERPDFKPGHYSMLAGGVFVASAANAIFTTAAVAGLTDFHSSIDSGGPTHTELILTTTTAKGNDYLARKTDVYYVEESDTTLFAPLKKTAYKEMKVVQ